MSNKSGKKSGSDKPGTFKPGDDPRRGNGPEKGAANAGRPADEWKEYWRTAVNKAEVLEAAESILKTPGHPQFKAVLQWASEQGYGKPSQPITGENGGPIVVEIINPRSK